jgi:hypothetical protein
MVEFPEKTPNSKVANNDWLSLLKRVRIRRSKPTTPEKLNTEVAVQPRLHEKSQDSLFRIQEVVTLGSLMAHGLDFNLEITPIALGKDFEFLSPLKLDRAGLEVGKNKLDKINFDYNYTFYLVAMNEMATNTLSEGTSQYLNLLRPNYDSVPLFKSELKAFISEAMDLYIQVNLNHEYDPAKEDKIFNLKQTFLLALLKEYMGALPKSLHTQLPGLELLEEYRQENNQGLDYVIDQMSQKIERKKAKGLSNLPSLDQVLEPFLVAHPEMENLRLELNPTVSNLELCLAWLATRSKKSTLPLFLSYLDRKLMLFDVLPPAGSYMLEEGTFSVNSEDSEAYRRFVKIKARVNGTLLGLSFVLPFPMWVLPFTAMLVKSYKDGVQVWAWPSQSASNAHSTYDHEFVHKLSAYKNNEEAKVGFIRLKKKKNKAISNS